MRSKLFGACLLGIIVGFLLSHAVLIKESNTTERTTDTAVSGDCARGNLVAKSACEKKVIEKGEYSSLKAELNVYIDSLKRDGIVSDVAVYFRDLESGPTMGINEYADFTAASLLKIPTLIVYLSIAEKQPDILNEKLSLDQSLDIESRYQQHYPPNEKIQLNVQYTVRELLRRAITYSDNVALEMLNKKLLNTASGNDLFIETYKELGLVPDAVNGEYQLSVKRYSSIYRTLYASTYLSPERSQEALDLLTQSAFANGLVAGLPDDLVIAHKFGERESVSTDGQKTTQKQLHDCGIIYYPENPYLLCVMTRGSDYAELEKVIQHISQSVYEEVDSRKIE